MGKPPSLSLHRGLGVGCDFSLSQTKAGPWHLSTDSCVLQLLHSQTQGRCQFGEGGDHRHTHSHFTSFLHTPPSAHPMPPVAHPIPISPPSTPKTQSFGNRAPIPHGSADLPHCTRPAEPAAGALRYLCPAKEELGGWGVWQEMGSLVPDGCLSLKLLFLGLGASWGSPKRLEAPGVQTRKWGGKIHKLTGMERR